MLAKACALALLAATTKAQCTLPAELPADTAFVAGSPAECVLGARERLSSGPSCPHPRAEAAALTHAAR